MNRYPKTVLEVLDDKIKYKTKVNKALIDFKNQKPFHGTEKERREKIEILNETLAKIYKIKLPKILFLSILPSGYIRKSNVIILKNLSVVTFLHEFGHALGKNERQTCKWSINLFKKHFPEIYKTLDHKGHMLIKEKENLPGELKDDIIDGVILFSLFTMSLYFILLR